MQMNDFLMVFLGYNAKIMPKLAKCVIFLSNV